MTGFIRGLFGSKSKRNVEDPQSNDAFYLSDDDAKTFGDIDYMRSSRKTRRTFSKKVVGEINEFLNDVSSLKKADSAEKSKLTGSSFDSASSNGSQAAAKPSESSSNSSERRRADPSMEMFRTMARDIKKKG